MKKLLLIGCCLATLTRAEAQTESDALMMLKNNICVGPMYQHSSWKQYWEGTFKRDNANLGTVSTSMYSVMGNYGLTNTVNLLFGLPYVKTKASAGTLRGMEGIQDLSLWIKWQALQKSSGSTTVSLFAIGGYATPLSGYTPDFLPMSIGLASRNVSLRGIADVEWKKWFATVSATYVRRSNITIDREAYYTTEMHYSNEVQMPDAAQYNLRAGYRSHMLIAELLVGNWTTLGGFDITKNNMPFPSNRMNMTTAGFNFKYEIAPVSGLSVTGGAGYTIAGRNVGQATAYNIGLFYVMNLAGKK